MCESGWAKGTDCTQAWRCETAWHVPGLGEDGGAGAEVAMTQGRREKSGHEMLGNL